MQGHVCTNMLLNLIMNFNLMKNFIFLYFMSTKFQIKSFWLYFQKSNFQGVINSHFTFPSFAPATRLCPPKAYIGMITRKLKSLLQMTLNALKVCNNRMEAGSLIHFLICVSYPWPILQGWNLWVLVPTKTRTK